MIYKAFDVTFLGGLDIETIIKQNNYYFSPPNFIIYPMFTISTVELEEGFV